VPVVRAPGGRSVEPSPVQPPAGQRQNTDSTGARTPTAATPTYTSARSAAGKSSPEAEQRLAPRGPRRPHQRRARGRAGVSGTGQGNRPRPPPVRVERRQSGPQRRGLTDIAFDATPAATLGRDL